MNRKRRKKRCAQCGKKFRPGRRGKAQRFCCRQCKVRFYYPPASPAPPRICANPKCGKQFTPTSNQRGPKTKTCSEECGLVLKRLKVRDWKKAHPKRVKRLNALSRRRCVDKNRPKVSAQCRLKRTGFTPEEFNRKVQQQGGVCPVFGIPLLTSGMLGYHSGAYNTAVADHDHVTRWRRGVLTRAANLLLGQFQDDPELLRQAGLFKAAEYLERYQF
jgi:hypothetical protein